MVPRYSGVVYIRPRRLFQLADNGDTRDESLFWERKFITPRRVNSDSPPRVVLSSSSSSISLYISLSLSRFLLQVRRVKGEVTVTGINLRNERGAFGRCSKVGAITGVTGVSANYFRSKNFLLRTVGPCCFFGINASPDNVKPLNGANETRVGYTSRFSLVINLVAFLHTLSRIFQYVLSILRC